MRLLRIVVALCLFILASAGRTEWFLKPMSEQVQGGQTLDIAVFVLNESASPIADGMPAKLPATARTATTSATVTLEAVSPGADLAEPIAPGAFRKQIYRVRIPENLGGTVQLELERVPSARTNVVVNPDSANERVARLAAPAALRVDTVPEPVLSPYEPMYIVAGTRGDNSARFQLSFKYRLFDERGALAQAVPGIDKVHFGFTQTSLWDIGGSSAPFRDTSYRPALFYYDPQLTLSADGRHLLGLESGFEHESNGRDGERSRSINIAYVRPSWRGFVDDEHYLSVGPKIYAYLEREDNTDIGQYRGHVDLNVRYGKRDGWLLSSVLRKGNGPYHSVQLDASYPIRQPFFANAGGYLYFQYFNGYGETLLDYNVKRPAQFRVGFAIVR